MSRASHQPSFGHPPSTLRLWRALARRASNAGASTPCYLFSADPIQEGIRELQVLEAPQARWRVRHWFSCKTQPLPAVLQWWRRQGRPIEVVSELEFRLATEAGFRLEDILVNGPAKHRWLPKVSAPGLRVNFDSPHELAALLPLAKRHRWRTGLRLLTDEECDPDHPVAADVSRLHHSENQSGLTSAATQFGFEPELVAEAVRRLRRAGREPDTVHFHLRTNVANPDCYARAIRQVAEICQSAQWHPRHLDIGGGLPPPHTLSLDGRRFDSEMNLRKFTTMLRREAQQFPNLRELWLENGRFLCARSGALLITVVDVKERRGLRQLICDGGRTLHALVSNWEQHELISLPSRTGPRTLTAVYGPTCMAFDQLARRPLPRSLQSGDRLLWLDAGGYHLPWETRFSHPLAEIWWHEGQKLRCARRADSRWTV